MTHQAWSGQATVSMRSAIGASSCRGSTSLYRVVKNTNYNPFADLSIEGKGNDAKYKYIL
jgi:hypothetical protein